MYITYTAVFVRRHVLRTNADLLKTAVCEEMGKVIKKCPAEETGSLTFQKIYDRCPKINRCHLSLILVTSCVQLKSF